MSRAIKHLNGVLWAFFQARENNRENKEEFDRTKFKLYCF